MIDRLSESIARATTPRPSSPDNQHKTSQSPYRGRDLEEAVRRTESEKRNQGVKKTKKKSSFSAAIEKTKEKAINANWDKVYEEQRKQEAENAAAAKKRRMAEARAVDAEKTRREKTHQARVSEDKRLKEEARKKRRSDFEQYMDSRLNERRKDNIRRALAKAAKQTKYR